MEDVVDPNKFGNISCSSTVLALIFISMVDKWLKATDGNGATVQCEFFLLTTAKLLILLSTVS